MATLVDTGNTGLPDPPAPPRRGANPWRLSDTARKPEAVQPSVSPQLLEELIKRVQPQQAATREAPQPGPAAKRARPGLIGLVVLLIAISIVARLFLDERVNGNWVRYIGPLIFIAIVAHGLWRSRQRRGENRASRD
jgi:FtsZ-interacting cell division protein ZipA